MNSSKRPNILIIMSDQQGVDTISAYRKYFKDNAWLCHWVKTPNLDRVVSNGYSFLDAFSNNPVSSPARSVAFTGRYSTETGVTYNNIGIDHQVPNVGEWFEQHSDYKRIYCGKWHAGGRWNYPDVEGNRKIPGFETIPVAVSGTGDFNDFQVSGALTGFIANYRDDKPFLAVAGLMNPHDICYWIPNLWAEGLVPKTDIFNLGDSRPPLPPNHQVNFPDPEPHMQIGFSKDEWRNYLYDYCRMIEKLDADIGRLIQAVDSRDDQTLVIITSDHGDGLARHKRVQKWHPFDESVRVPFIAYMPGRVKTNVIDDQNMVSLVDMVPTICDFAGISAPPNCSGKSIKQLLETGVAAEKMNTAFMEYRHTGRVVRKDDFKYVKVYEHSGDDDQPFVRKSDGKPEKFRKGPGGNRYKETSIRLLFNVKDDPWEQVNLSEDPQYYAKVQELDNVLAQDWESRIEPGIHYDRN